MAIKHPKKRYPKKTPKGAIRLAIIGEMRRQGLNPFELRRLTGVSETTIYEFVKGNRPAIELTSAELLMEALGITVHVAARLPKTTKVNYAVVNHDEGDECPD